MNRARVASLLRELADALEENDIPEAEGSRPRAKRPARRPRALTRPDGEATPLVAAQAARLLKDRGFS